MDCEVHESVSHFLCTGDDQRTDLSYLSNGLREYRRHGEAGSVDLAAVAAERVRMQNILSEYAERDRFNFDESGLFPQCV